MMGIIIIHSKPRNMEFDIIRLKTMCVCAIKCVCAHTQADWKWAVPLASGQAGQTLGTRQGVSRIACCCDRLTLMHLCHRRQEAVVNVGQHRAQCYKKKSQQPVSTLTTSNIITVQSRLPSDADTYIIDTYAGTCMHRHVHRQPPHQDKSGVQTTTCHGPSSRAWNPPTTQTQHCMMLWQSFQSVHWCRLQLTPTQLFQAEGIVLQYMTENVWVWVWCVCACVCVGGWVGDILYIKLINPTQHPEIYICGTPLQVGGIEDHRPMFVHVVDNVPTRSYPALHVNVTTSPVEPVNDDTVPWDSNVRFEHAFAVHKQMHGC